MISYLFRGAPFVSPGNNNSVCQASEAAINAPLVDDGWTWTIQVMEAGWVNGSVEGASGVPQYVSMQALEQVAAACQSARFGRRYPSTSQEETDPTRIAGLISDGHVEEDRAVATLQLDPNETQIRAQLVGLKKAGALDLFGVSVSGNFEMEMKNIEGVMALELQNLTRLISVDLVLDAGAGGKILPFVAYRAAASEYLPHEVAIAREAAFQHAVDAKYLAAAQLILSAAETIMSDVRSQSEEQGRSRATR